VSAARIRVLRSFERSTLVTSTDNLAVSSALRQSQEVIVPFSIIMSLKVRNLATNGGIYTDIDLLACRFIDGVEGIRLVVDPRDGRLKTQLPIPGLVPNVLDVFIRTHPVWLVDTSDLELRH